jgi:CRP/FNR family transcriptional regulator
MTQPETLLETWFPGARADMRALRARVQKVDISEGRRVFHRGDPCRNYLVVIDGCVRVQVLSQGGREVVLYRVNDGQSCVITTSCLISREAYPAEGVTERDTGALVIPHGTFKSALACSETFRQFVFAGQGRRLSDLIRRVEDVAFGRVDARLAKHLLDCCLNNAGSVKATHQQLASELGTAREVISRQLKVFERSGWIAMHRGAVEVLKPQALALLADASR